VTRKVLFVTGTRADYGLWVPVLRAAAASADLEPMILATAMHLDDRFGSTMDEVRAGGIPIVAEVPCTPPGDSAVEMAAAIGQAIEGMAPVLERERPDWLLVLGDRGEQLAATVAGMHLGMAIVHLAGGDRTLGAVDDAVRDMISRAAALHLVASESARARLLAMGEADWRIRLVGSPGLDNLREFVLTGDTGKVRVRVGLPPSGEYLLIAMHPETRSGRLASADMEATLTATATTGLPRVIVYPNADAGGRAMIEQIGRHPNLHVAASLPRSEFAVLLANAASIVGNSSAGLIEAPLLKVPAVNVGRRQAGRLRGDNVIDVEPERDSIAGGLRGALDPEFRAALSGTSPYGDGHSAQRIVRALIDEPMTDELIFKDPGTVP
jgi:GDP/UDP-N,N'-diacetylbacillosamine 2-epimerase (hydrolysing)